MLFFAAIMVDSSWLNYFLRSLVHEVENGQLQRVLDCRQDKEEGTAHQEKEEFGVPVREQNLVNCFVQLLFAFWLFDKLFCY